MDFNVIKSQLSGVSDEKIILLVMDGLGGLPMEEGGQTELEAARTPKMDTLAGKSMLGLHESIRPGISHYLATTH
jgi:2,3-bisphosphoglycerate-independent phosphoglycerate mutase